MNPNNEIPVGINLIGMSPEQQLLIEDEMIVQLDKLVGGPNWTYRQWDAGYIEMGLHIDRTPHTVDSPTLTVETARIGMVVWSLLLACVIAHPNVQVVSWPDFSDVQRHLDDNSYKIPQPTVTWVDHTPLKGIE